ncbi:MAG: response regulator [Rickettsiella sp.]|nr:response regulator [Rickettsiella sp.]
MKKQQHILIVEDEIAIRDMLQLIFKSSPFQILQAENVQIARQKMVLKMPDLILLDWMLPDISGIDFIKQLRQKTKTRDIPIILLTARAEEDNKVKGLQMGADDYITKPFSPRELLARVQSVIRRGPLQSLEGLLVFKGLQLDSYQCQVKIAQQHLRLTSLEYRLLYFFMKHPNKVYSREELLEYIWGGTSDVNERSIDSLIKRLRKKLDEYSYAIYLKAVRGLGYQWDQSAKPSSFA